MTRTSRLLSGAIAALALFAAGCGSSKTAAPTTTTAPALQGSITVFAATSLKDAFTEAGTAFTAANPGAKVTFSFDSSSTLVTQITQGAPADVFASADTANMDKLTGASLNGTAPAVFATNSLAIIVAKGNPKSITGLADLTKAGLKVVLCAVAAPCGKYAQQILTNAKVALTPVSLETNVKGVVTKVTTGEADAGIVYITDIQAAASQADAVTIPADINVIAKYPIASVKVSTNAAIDQAFIDFITGSDGQAILAKYGFQKP